jgi:riboflavin synthase
MLAAAARIPPLAPMFTGIIETTGRVAAVEATPGGGRLLLHAPALPFAELGQGESLAVNGCCLTMTRIDPAAATLGFDLLRETLDVTNLGALAVGDLVNLERSMRLGDRLSGHMVQGHVDGTGIVTRLHPQGQDHVLEIELPPGAAAQIIPRGSIAIDGCSLTAAGLDERSVTIYLIPHTWEVTRLHSLAPGAKVNLEFDMIGKFVRRALEPLGLLPGGGS